MKNTVPAKCPMCGGHVEKGSTTFTVDLKTGVVIVRNVPAFVCQQCGEDWIDNETSGQLETIAERARKENAQLEMVSMG